MSATFVSNSVLLDMSCCTACPDSNTIQAQVTLSSVHLIVLGKCCGASLHLMNHQCFPVLTVTKVFELGMAYSATFESTLELT